MPWRTHRPMARSRSSFFTSLPGGDTNNDGVVDLFELVRVGASYRTTPPADPLADCTADGQVNLFDLVLVGSNYGKAGPVPFGNTGNDGLRRLDDDVAMGLPGVSGTTLATVRTLLGEDVVDWPAEPAVISEQDRTRERLRG